MVFEVLGENLLGLIKRYQSKGVPRGLVRQIAKQLLLGLDYMHRCCGVIHTDLKPENVLIVLDDIEARISNELHSSAPPSSKFVGVPPSMGRGGNQTPRSESFYITGSQPLPSPSSSPGSGKIHDRFAFGMSALNSPPSGPKSPGKGLSEAIKGVANISINTGLSTPGPTSSPGPSLLSQQFASHHPMSPPSHITTSNPITPRSGNSPPEVPATSSTIPSPSDPLSLALNETLRARAELSNASAPPSETITVKIADLGNATWIDHHFTEEIQTRQYRSPEVILGARWGPSADIWSVACLLFELLTGGDYLFDPNGGQKYGKDDDHIAQIIELLGPLPKSLAFSGRHSGQFFRRTGELRHIHRLRFWPLESVLKEKYLYEPGEAELVASFLTPMLCTDPERRASAAQMLAHPILQGISVRGEMVVQQRQSYGQQAGPAGRRSPKEAALKPVNVPPSHAVHIHGVPVLSMGIGRMEE